MTLRKYLNQDAVQHLGINVRLRMEPQNHPKQHGCAIPVIRSIVVFPVLHQRQQLMLSIGDEFICPFRQGWIVAVPLWQRKSAGHESKVLNPSVVAQVAIKDQRVQISIVEGSEVPVVTNEAQNIDLLDEDLNMIEESLERLEESSQDFNENAKIKPGVLKLAQAQQQ